MKALTEIPDGKPPGFFLAKSPRSEDAVSVSVQGAVAVHEVDGAVIVVLFMYTRSMPPDTSEMTCGSVVPPAVGVKVKPLTLTLLRLIAVSVPGTGLATDTSLREGGGVGPPGLEA
jgi:hypothetical protein